MFRVTKAQGSRVTLNICLFKTSNCLTIAANSEQHINQPYFSNLFGINRQFNLQTL